MGRSKYVDALNAKDQEISRLKGELESYATAEKFTLSESINEMKPLLEKLENYTKTIHLSLNHADFEKREKEFIGIINRNKQLEKTFGDYTNGSPKTFQIEQGNAKYLIEPTLTLGVTDINTSKIVNYVLSDEGFKGEEYQIRVGQSIFHDDENLSCKITLMSATYASSATFSMTCQSKVKTIHQ